MSKTEDSLRTRSKGEMDSGGPDTDSDSKTVMLTAERGDIINITQVLSQKGEFAIPDELEVIQQTETYYGPKLFTYASIEGQNRNFLLTAPGPNSQLRLWTEDLSSRGKREGWTEGAEVTASLAVEQPPYERCSECGEVIRTVEHERAALSGQCSRKETWN